ncbi:hypothetical protein CK936_21525 [Streptomyces albireticuli]|uniref:Uncharacterized protein n=1 Tax=Streptomyces albireticuli TaxID=1940 RepID=A0A2A2D618_9ACTN|nr:hypothetical protein CK936_21525 [Streptomyces albireticuli]
MADDLFLRYMRAFQTSTEHVDGCAACQAYEPCQVGKPLHERFARLQDAYVQRRARQNRR